jgi:nicotinamidase-related amidase
MTDTLFNRTANRAAKGLAVAVLRRQLSYGSDDTAVVLVGTQRDLLTDPGVVAKLVDLTAAARASGLPVVYALALPPTPENGIRYPTPSQRALLKGDLLRPGTPGADIHPDLAPQRDDIVMTPSAALSAFAGTELAARLSALGAGRIVVAGARTDVEVESTARDAVELGLQTTVVSDCCAGTSAGNHRASIATTLPRVVHGVLTLHHLTARMR